MKKNITIINYGSGNILSAMQSFAKVIKINNLDADVSISGNPSSIKNSSHLGRIGDFAEIAAENNIISIHSMAESD